MYVEPRACQRGDHKPILGAFQQRLAADLFPAPLQRGKQTAQGAELNLHRTGTIGGRITAIGLDLLATEAVALGEPPHGFDGGMHQVRLKLFNALQNDPRAIGIETIDRRLVRRPGSLDKDFFQADFLLLGRIAGQQQGPYAA